MLVAMLGRHEGISSLPESTPDSNDDGNQPRDLYGSPKARHPNDAILLCPFPAPSGMFLARMEERARFGSMIMGWVRARLGSGMRVLRR